MNHTSVTRKLLRRVLSLLLILSVMVSLAVPVTVHAEETAEQAATGAGEAATDESIYALLYIKDKTQTTTSSQNFNGYQTNKNMELVFQNNRNSDPNKILIDTFSGFAGTCYHEREEYVSNSVVEIRNSNYKPVPWYISNKYTLPTTWETTARNIVSVDFKDEIAPTYIASWFYGFQRIQDFKHLSNLKTHNCKDMSYAFYCSTSTSWDWDTPEVTELDFSHFNTSNVEQIDNFVRLNSLQRLNLSGFNLKNVKYMTSFIVNSKRLTDINFTGFDMSEVKSVVTFVSSCGALETVDISSINPTSAHDLRNFFSQCKSLKNVTFAENFSPGRDFPTDPVEAPDGYEGLTYTSSGKTYIAGSGFNRVRLTAMFNGCESLEEIDFANWNLHVTKDDDTLSKRYYEIPSFFRNCKSLTKIKNIDHLIIEENSAREWTHRYMFDGCESLESIDLSNSKTLIGGPGIFRGCKNLKKLDFSGFGLNWWKNNWYYYTNMRFYEYDSDSSVKKDVNIYEGCEELSEVTFSQYYPPSNQVIYKSGTTEYPIGYGSCKPPVDRTWIKIKDPVDKNTYSSYIKSDGKPGDYKYPCDKDGDYKVDWKIIREEYPNLTPVDTRLSTEELFCNFQPQYAGTWVAEAKINFNAKGGTPAQQSFSGSRGVKLNISEGALIEPTRNGYTFKGWYYEDEKGVERAFENNTTAQAWTYYAKWEPIKYNIVLHSNDGTDQTESKPNVKYDEFVPLSGSTFVSSDSSKILAGWNTTPAGNGEDFAANESVDKLTTIEGHTVDLYAMWRTPDAIVTFDSRGGSSVAQRDYTLQDGVSTPYGHLSEPIRDGYTFVGWYTEPDGKGRKVVLTEHDSSTETAYVSGSETLYAYWQKKPVITFKLQGGKINNDTADYSKVVDYGQPIGTIPTPSLGSQTFEGWYTEDGLKLTEPEAAIATADAIYYARWSWKPTFETNGGSYQMVVDVDTGEESYNILSYPSQENPKYKFDYLPVVVRPNYTFDGWYTEKGIKVTEGAEVDLSDQGSVLKATWIRGATSTVTLNPDGGTMTIDGVEVTETKEYTEVYNGEQIGELPVPVKANADFAGWYSGDTKYTYKSRINGDITLTAKWVAQNHTVTFNPTDGEMVGDTVYTIAHDKAFTYLPGANCVENVGGASIIQKSFDGWYTEPNGGGTKLESSTPITADTTYYANWVDNRHSADNYSSMIRWSTLSSADVTNVGDTLVFHPQGKGDIAAHLTVDFAYLNQEDTLIKDDVRITLPKEMFLGWNNEDVTTAPKVFPNFSYTEDGDNIVLTNSSIFKSTVFEPTYTVDPMMVKGGYTDENGVYQGYFQKKFKVKIELKDKDTKQYQVFQERELGVEVHTSVHTNVYKEQSTATLNWSSSWGPEPPDAQEYFYVIWNLKSNNLNSTQPYQLSWSENTVHDGSVVYAPDLGKWSNVYTSDSNNTIQIVTKHRRDEAMAQGSWAKVRNEAILNVKWKSGFEEQFRAIGKATAFVGELYPDGTRALTKQIPNMNDQNAHMIDGGQDVVLNGEANSLDPLEYRLTYTEKENTDKQLLSWSESGEMIVPPRTYVLSDGVKDRKDVLICGATKNDSVVRGQWDPAGQTQLDDGDYYFTYLDITLNEYDSVYLNGGWSDPYQNNNYLDYGNLIVSIRKMGSGNFETLKTFYPSDLHPVDGENGGYSARIELPADTVGYKVEYTSKRYTTAIKASTGMKLKASRKIHSIVSSHANEGKNTIIKNKAEMNVSCGEKNEVCESKSFTPWWSSYELTLSESELKVWKDCLNENNNSQAKFFVTDPIASTVEFPVAVSGWAYSKNKIGHYKRVKAGVFYDLLPHGFTVDKSSIFVCARSKAHCDAMKGTETNGKAMNGPNTTAFATSYNEGFTFPGKIGSDYYSVIFKDNWEGSGKTMMIVDINCPEDVKATGFIVYYKCKTTINNLHINGSAPKNYVSFYDKTEEQSLPEIRTMSLNGIPDSAVRSLYASVDNSQTAYNYGTTTLIPPIVYQYGADSNVTTEGAEISKHQIVGLNTDYAYNISYESNSTKTQDLIIYDVIEKQIGGNESQWQGVFKSIDVSSIKEQESSTSTPTGKCAPVVYYSTKPKSEFVDKSLFDLDRLDVWTKTPPADMAQVTAIAVDCRKTDIGADFVLGKNKGLEFTINMHSPANETRNEIDTYNEAVFKGNNRESTGTVINANTRTSVTLRFINPRFVKTAFPASGTQEKPESVVKNSVLDYTLSITNPDPELPMTNVVVEDRFPTALVPNNRYTVRFNGGNSIDINNTARVSYTITTDNDARVFTANIVSLEPGETVEITIPVKVGLEKDAAITNEAKITSINGVSYSNIKSNQTYHKVTGVKAKVLKVNSKGEPLEGATLQIFEQNERNCDANGKLKEGAKPLTLTNDGQSIGDHFTSGTEVAHFDVAAGSYILHETAVPDGSGYERAEDIPFTVDVEGIIHVNGESVNYVEMVNKPPYKIIFHENNQEINDKNVVFRIFEPQNLTENKIPHFYDIPSFAGDEYVFAGWYHNDGYTAIDTPDEAQLLPADFENDSFVSKNTGDDPDYHLYAKWIKVGSVQKSAGDTNLVSGYRGFGLAGVQIRPKTMKILDEDTNEYVDANLYDPNVREKIDGFSDDEYNDKVKETPEGMRFVTSMSESLLSSINDIGKISTASSEAQNFGVEYGYAVGTEENIKQFMNHYNVADEADYMLQYKGENVNGVDTTGSDKSNRTADTDYRYITNIDCTSGHGKNNNDGVVRDDHRNFDGEYRLFTLVVTYDDAESKQKLGDKLDARAYLRYYDANGKLRVFYNIYKKSMYHGGCLCSFNQVSSMAMGTKTESGE